MTGLSDIKLYYCTIPGKPESLGRGEFVNLLLKDSGLDYEYIRVPMDEFKASKPKLIAEGLVQPTVPYMVADGKYYGKAYPIIRFLVKKLGKYDGKDDDEAQRVDAIADSVADWYTKWGTALFGGQEGAFKTYIDDTHPSLLKEFDTVLASSNGPYLLGEQITYADFMLYHVIDDSKNTGADSTADYPNISKFIQAIENRPNLKSYIASVKK